MWLVNKIVSWAIIIAIVVYFIDVPRYAGRLGESLTRVMSGAVEQAGGLAARFQKGYEDGKKR